MKSVAPPPPCHRTFAFSLSPPRFYPQNPRFRVLCSPPHQSQSTMGITESDSRPTKYRPGILDDLFLNLFRNRMVHEVGWDSEKPGYDGLIEVANHLVMRRSNPETKKAAVRILKALFPPFLLELYRMLISPLQGGKVAAMMVARVTALSCQWLMGPCAVNNVDLPDGSSLRSGVFVERCKYLEESKCVGICINTCKLPTQNGGDVKQSNTSSNFEANATFNSRPTVLGSRRRKFNFTLRSPISIYQGSIMSMEGMTNVVPLGFRKCIGNRIRNIYVIRHYFVLVT